MAPGERAIIEIAAAILDGTPVDWTVSAEDDGTDRRVLDELRLLGLLADVYRQHGAACPVEAHTGLPEAWGHLRILELLGRGAFGAVYRSWDTRLDREVALKLLPADPVVAGTSSIIEEGRLLARVRHPNVVTIYGAERTGSHIGLWMELVEGPTLEERLRQERTLAPSEVRRIGFELAQALTAVHGAGLLHRDVKAQNVIVSPEGRVVLMDFGTGRDVRSAVVSEVAGTPLYLAPELFGGGPASVQSDIYSLGVLLFHLLTGAYPVFAASLTDLRRAHASEARASLVVMRPDVDAALADAIARATDPRPERRQNTALEVAEELAALQAPDVARAQARGGPRFWDRRALPAWAIGALVVAGAAASLHTLTDSRARTAPGVTPTAAAELAGPLMQLTSGPHLTTESTVSPDGEWLAYASDRSEDGHLDLWMQPLNGGEPVRLTREPGDDREPAFTADGARLAFRSERAGGGIYSIPAGGTGEATLLVGGDAHGPRFSPDGRWLAYSRGPGRFSADKIAAALSETYLAAADGSQPVQLLPGFASVAWPVWSPDGRRLLVTASRALTDALAWYTVTVDSQAVRKVAGLGDVSNQGQFPVRPWSWSPTDRILYTSAGGGNSWDLWEVAFQPAASAVAGPPRRLTTGTAIQAHASVMGNGRIIFASLNHTVNVWSVPLGSGEEGSDTLRRIPGAAPLQWWPSASRNGRALVYGGKGLAAEGMWLRKVEEGTETLLVRSREPLSPVISADGSRIAYSSSRERGFVVYAIPSSGGTSEVVCTECGGSFVHDWSNDNARLLYGSDEPTAVFTLEIESGEKRRVLARPPHSLWQARFSPDDRWVSVLETLDGGFPTRIWIAPFHQDRASDPESWIPVTDGASWDDKPRWAADGNTLYFTSLRDGFHCLWAQRLQPDTKRPAGAPYPVRHFHTARLSMNNTGFIGLETAVSHDRLFINLGELSGNIWTTLLR